MDWSFQNLFNAVSVGAGVVVFVVLVARNAIQKRDARLENILAKVLVASSFPTGVALFLCAFNPSLIAQLIGLNIHIALAGMALLYISGRTLFRSESFEEDKEKGKDNSHNDAPPDKR